MKTSLNRELENIQNLAFSAYLLATFTDAFYDEAQEFPSLHFLFVVYPLFYLSDISELIEHTHKTTGLLGCISKLKDGENKRNDMLLCLQTAIDDCREEIMDAIKIAFLSNMLSIGADGRIIPVKSNIKKIKVEGHEVNQLYKVATKLGAWFSQMTIYEIEQILKVRF